jgi:hypothetical protein
MEGDLKETGVMFKGRLVNLLLRDLKTQTRRPARVDGLKPTMVRRGSEDAPEAFTHAVKIRDRWYDVEAPGVRDGTSHGTLLTLCPYGDVGSRIWVRETFLPYYECKTCDEPGAGHRHGWPAFDTCHICWRNAIYRADDADISDWGADNSPARWTPAIHMPRWASRITLEVKRVRFDRLCAISEEDAIAEGVTRADGRWYDGAPHRIKGTPTAHPTAREAFMSIWKHAYGEDSWFENPYVWVVDFKRIVCASEAVIRALSERLEVDAARTGAKERDHLPVDRAFWNTRAAIQLGSAESARNAQVVRA